MARTTLGRRSFALGIAAWYTIDRRVVYHLRARPARIMIDRTYHRLKESIYRGRLRPGQRLVERELARRMGVSRIPLRESLVRLETEGLVRSVPYSATFVEDLSAEDMLEIYSMRRALEPLATQLAAVRADAPLVEKLRRLCDQMTRDTVAQNIPQLDRTDYRFHHTIVVGSGHKRLLRAYESAHIRIVGPQVDFAHILDAPADKTAKEHLELVDLIEKRDAKGAYKLALEQVNRSMHAVEAALGTTLEEIRNSYVVASSNPSVAATNTTNKKGERT